MSLPFSLNKITRTLPKAQNIVTTETTFRKPPFNPEITPLFEENPKGSTSIRINSPQKWRDLDELANCPLVDLKIEAKEYSRYADELSSINALKAQRLFQGEALMHDLDTLDNCPSRDLNTKPNTYPRYAEQLVLMRMEKRSKHLDYPIKKQALLDAMLKELSANFGDNMATNVMQTLNHSPVFDFLVKATLTSDDDDAQYFIKKLVEKPREGFENKAEEFRGTRSAQYRDELSWDEVINRPITSRHLKNP